jgi:hypothetical protein
MSASPPKDGAADRIRGVPALQRPSLAEFPAINLLWISA